MRTEQYEKTKNHNTNYYRRNKAQRFNVKSCEQCGYETTGPKSSLQAHVWSKHTPENKRPHQCPCEECGKGFSARANLNKHILKKHNILMPKKVDHSVLLYKISVGLSREPGESLVEDRVAYYKSNPYIIPGQLPIKYNGQLITYNTIYYDSGYKLIDIVPLSREDLLTPLKHR